MTNIDRAARAVWEASRGVGAPLSGIASDHIAAVLADATPPLLMPDLPVPDRDGLWWPERGRNYGHVRLGSVRSDNDRVVISRGGPGVASRYTSMTLTKNEALELASILLAAADYAERNQA